MLRIPLRARGNLLGALDLVRRGDAAPFSEKDTDFSVDVAERVALALDNALLLRAQREALEEQVKFKALADATSDLIAITDTDAIATYVNARVAELGEQWVGTSFRDVFAAHIAEDVVGDVEEGLASRGRWRGDLTLTRRRPGRRWRAPRPSTSSTPRPGPRWARCGWRRTSPSS